MATAIQTAKRIRFELNQLSASNAHHEFEHLCRHFARTRICSNILPATGPVSAGGDQGRDFETFRTYLQASPIADSTFVGMISRSPIAFACTLTKSEDLKDKIKSDVDTIMASGVPVIDIHYFCANDLPVGRRHEIQHWAHETHGVQVEIYDGQAISEQLADRDVFWIAEQFLGIPADIYPALPPNLAVQWYTTAIQKWKNAIDSPPSFADFFQIKDAIRYAYSKDGPNQDISFWIQHLDSLIASTPYPSLKRKSVYEIAVAKLRGFGSMIGYEDCLRQYFSDIPSLTQISEIEDTAILLKFCTGASFQNAINLSIEELTTWHEQITSRIEAELRNTEQPDKRCALLCNRGYMQLGPSPQHELDIDGALSSWLELASLVKDAPLFPLEDFADTLSKLLCIPQDILPLSDHPDFHGLTTQIDQHISARFGAFVAAEKCRDRAVALYEKGEILRALKEIHVARVKWFAEETLRGAVLTMLFISCCYLDLGLTFASKYYALAAAHISASSDNQEVKEYISQALVRAAEADYLQVSFISFLDLSDMALRAFGAFSDQEGLTCSGNEIETTVFHSTMVRVFSDHFAPELREIIDEKINRWEGLGDYFSSLQPHADRAWHDKKQDELWESLENQLLGRPFGDIGEKRITTFCALGVTWVFEWENTYLTTSLSEELLATLQIWLADLADTDLLLLPTTLDVAIQLGAKSDAGISPIPSNESTKWKMTLSAESDPNWDSFLVSIVSTLLYSVSVLPNDEIVKRLERAFQEGLSSKSFFAQRYRNLYSEFINQEVFDESGCRTRSLPHADISFRTRIHAQLAWHDALGPGYSEQLARETVRKRYENSIVPIQHTLKRLVQEPSFHETVCVLRSQNWLDWHILTAIALAVVNYRVNKELVFSRDPQAYQKRFFELMNTKENESFAPVPMACFSTKELQMQLNLSMLSTMKVFGLEMHQQTPDFGAVSRFLGERYRYWSDDIEHEDFGF